jgi:hypothetical protein
MHDHCRTNTIADMVRSYNKEFCNDGEVCMPDDQDVLLKSPASLDA